MYNLLIALAAAATSTGVFAYLLGSIWYGLVPGLLAGVVVYFFLARRTFKQFESLVKQAQQQIQSGNVDAAIRKLKEGYPLAKWQFLVDSQLNAQIGSFLFQAQREDEAEQYLKNAFSRHWQAQAMLGVYYYKNKKLDKMRETFEDAVAYNKKQPLLWNLYAYCLWKSRNRDDAIDVLNRAMDKLPDDDTKTEKNLDNLKNGNKMKMGGWGQQWYQFRLQPPPRQSRRGGGGGQFHRQRR
jgi:tetratricopeptide (TPR) repeat protein